jgi:hypothetical protein
MSGRATGFSQGSILTGKPVSVEHSFPATAFRFRIMVPSPGRVTTLATAALKLYREISAKPAMPTLVSVRG